MAFTKTMPKGGGTNNNITSDKGPTMPSGKFGRPTARGVGVKSPKGLRKGGK